MDPGFRRDDICGFGIRNAHYLHCARRIATAACSGLAMMKLI
jgi:hypothetical protein